MHHVVQVQAPNSRGMRPAAWFYKAATSTLASMFQSVSRVCRRPHSTCALTLGHAEHTDTAHPDGLWEGKIVNAIRKGDRVLFMVFFQVHHAPLMSLMSPLELALHAGGLPTRGDG